MVPFFGKGFLSYLAFLALAGKEILAADYVESTDASNGNVALRGAMPAIDFAASRELSTASMYYLGCGKRGTCPVQSGRQDIWFAPLTERKHYVRCCSNRKVDDSFKQVGNCWGSSGTTCDTVWRNYTQAYDFCTVLGARLCTIEELYDGCSSGTGCSRDNKWIWTSSQYVPPAPIVQSEALHWAVCGIPGSSNCEDKNGKSAAAIGASGTEKLAVRCCSSTSLKWDGTIKNTCKNPNVFAASAVPLFGSWGGPDACYASSTHAEAESICSRAGARLCTYDELMNGCASGTGCSIDSSFIWSSTEYVEEIDEGLGVVVEQSDGNHFLACGGGTPQDQCLDAAGKMQITKPSFDQERHNVRCCSDTKLNWRFAKTHGAVCNNVWAGSDIPTLADPSKSKCYANHTYAEAEYICESHGARLCTQVEVGNGCLLGTGCGFDDTWVWTSTEVVEPVPVPATNGFHLLACGNPTPTSGAGCRDSSGNFFPAYRARDADKHEVRCCSETALPFFENVEAVLNTGCGAYAFSEAPIIPGTVQNVQCMTARSHWEADAMCKTHGARLCTDTEMLMGCARKSGCNYDNEWVWTSTEACTTPAECEGDLNADRHLGCYEELDGIPHLEFKVGSPYLIDQCYAACHKAKYSFFGMKNGNICYCGMNNDADAKVDPSMCSKSCMMGKGSCGGPQTVSVYRTGWARHTDYNYEQEFRGCVLDESNMLNTKVSDSSSIKICVETCTERNFAMAGLKNGGECWCGDERPLTKSIDCDAACPIGRGLCGGKNGGVSLYKTTSGKMALKSMMECTGALANIWGDPHIVTFDDRKYGCQGVGHFIITECVDYMLQGIFKAATHTSKASSTTGMVAKYKNYPKVQAMISEVPGPLTVMMDDCPVDLYIGGQLYNTSNLDSAPIAIKMGLTQFEIQFPDGGPAIRAKVRNGRGCLFDLDTCVHEECFPSTKGLLGTPNGIPMDDWMYRDGRIYPGDLSAFEYCTGIWCIQSASESLFTYPPGMSFSDFDQCSENPVDPGPVDTSNVPPEAAEVCAGLEGGLGMQEACLIDLAEADDVNRTLEEIQENMFDIVIDEIVEDPIPPLPPCPEDVQILAHIGSTNFTASPVKIVSFDTETVTVEITSPRPNYSLDEFYVWHPLQSSGEACDGFVNIGESFKETFTLQCRKFGSPVALLHIFAIDAELYSFEAGDDATVPNCCHATDGVPAVEYTYQISCVPQCPLDAYETSRKRERRLANFRNKSNRN